MYTGVFVDKKIYIRTHGSEACSQELQVHAPQIKHVATTVSYLRVATVSLF